MMSWSNPFETNYLPIIIINQIKLHNFLKYHASIIMGLNIKFGGGVGWLVYGALRKAQGLRVRLETAYCG